MLAVVKRISLALAALAFVLWLMPGSEAAAPLREDRLALGTLVTLKLYGDEEQTRPLLERAYAEFDRVDSLMSRYRQDSELSLLSRRSAAQIVEVSPEVLKVLQRSLHWARVSQGAFDPTIGALTRLWNFPDARSVPDSAAIDSVLALVGYEALSIEASSVRLRHEGVELDLGAAAKGYAVDRAVVLLRGLGVVAGLIEAGGDIRYWGEKPNGSPWRFGIQHPRMPEKYFEVEDIGLAAIATSGDYEQQFEQDGRRYHHILNPGNGWPARGVISATVWAQTAMDADMLSTAVFVLGAIDGLQWAEDLPEVEALIFSEGEDGLRSWATSGVQGRFRFVE